MQKPINNSNSEVDILQPANKTAQERLLDGLRLSITEFAAYHSRRRVPLGYSEEFVILDERQGRSTLRIAIDHDRAAIIQWAFIAFASGTYTMTTLRNQAVAKGLTTFPTSKKPAKPISTKQLHDILCNPYYLGSMTSENQRRTSTHDALVGDEVFNQVQKHLR